MPYYPYFLVKNVWSVRKLYFFPHSLRLLGVCKNQINIIWAAMMQKFIKYFFFSCNSFFGTLILVFPSHCNVVLLFKENFVCFLCLFLSLKTLRTSLLSLLFMIKIPTYALLFLKFWALIYPYFFVGGHLKAWAYIMSVNKIVQVVENHFYSFWLLFWWSNFFKNPRKCCIAIWYDAFSRHFIE